MSISLKVLTPRRSSDVLPGNSHSPAPTDLGRWSAPVQLIPPLSNRGLQRPATRRGPLVLNNAAAVRPTVCPSLQIAAADRDTVLKTDRAYEASKVLAKVDVDERRRILRAVSCALATDANIERLALPIMQESKKPWREAVGEAKNCGELFAEGSEAQFPAPETRLDKRGVATRMWYPFGVIVVVTARNFPAGLGCRHIPAAILAGNAVLWQSHHLTPRSADVLGSIIQETLRVELPAIEDAVMVIHPSLERSAYLLAREPINKLFFVGSPQVGESLAATVRQIRGQEFPFHQEGGGPNFMVVDRDADLPACAELIIESSVPGTRCTSGRVIVAHADVADALGELLRERLRQVVHLAPPDGEVPPGAVHVPPVMNAEAVELHHYKIKQAVDCGGSVDYFGMLPSAGHFVQTALLTVPNTDRAWKEILQIEHFGRTVAMVKVEDIDTVLQTRIAPAISGSFFTKTRARADEMMDLAMGKATVLSWMYPTIGTSFLPIPVAEPTAHLRNLWWRTPETP